MSDEKGKKAGGISKFKQQYGQIGRGTPSKRLDSQESGSQDSETSKHLTIETSKHQDAQPLEPPAIQDAKQLDGQPSNYQDIQPLERSTIEASRMPDGQPSSLQTIQPSESQSKGESSMSDLATVEHSSDQKVKSKQRDKLTVYLEPELNDWVRQQVIIEKRRRGHHVEISDIINEALQKAKDSNG